MTTVAAGTWTVDLAHTRAGFAARHLFGSTVHGTIAVTAGTIEVGTDGRPVRLHATLDPASIDTGNARRDSDLRGRRFLAVDAYPLMELAADRIAATARGWHVDAVLCGHGCEAPCGEAAMTAPLIAPLIPLRARPGGREHGRTGTTRPLPVAAAPDVPAVPDDVVYGFGRMDESGRVADRATTSALGWQPGNRLTVTAAAGVVIAHGATADPLATRYARHLARQAGQRADADIPAIPERRLIRRTASGG